MNYLRKAAEDLMPILERWKMTYPPCSGADWEKVEALRQALAQHVDAVNISAERVDETAKGEHEPFIYVREDNERPFGGYEHCSEADAGAFPVYTAPPKREWVGLTDEEVESWRGNYDFFDSALVRKVEAKLKEKNT